MIRPLAALALLPALAQDTDQPIRVTVQLVQFDAVVTTRDGKPVRGLTKNDFTILQDGKPRDIVSFTAIEAGAAPTKSAAATLPGLPPPPEIRKRLARQDIRRTLAIVLDDRTLQFESVARVRQSIATFLDTEFRDGDIAAILRTGSFSSAFQEFTNDRGLLKTVAERIRWNPEIMRRGIDEKTPTRFLAHGIVSRDYIGADLFGSLPFLIRGMANMPGRKSVVFYSEGFFPGGMGDPNDADSRINQIIDAANRAGVAIYTIDARGLRALDMSVQPSESTSDSGATTFESMTALDRVARETGGLTFHSNNDLAGGLARAMSDQQYYYLIGYNPGSEPFERKFHRVEVRTNRPDLRVRARGGFIGKEATPEPGEQRLKLSDALDSPSAALAVAIESPFHAADLPVRLTSYFTVEKTETVVQSALHIDTTALEFQRQDDGTFAAMGHLLVAGFNEAGGIAGHESRAFAIRATADTLPVMRRSGAVYVARFKTPKPGPYQVRAAVRDKVTGRTGTASFFLVAPDIRKKKEFALSGLMVRASPEAPAVVLATANPAVRRFPAGSSVVWSTQLYNPRSPAEKLSATIRVLRDGKMLLESTHPPQSFGLKNEDPVLAGSFRLGTTPPGDYALQVIIRDPKRPKGRDIAMQWIDFEVLPGSPALKSAAP